MTATSIARRARLKGLYIDCRAITAPVYEKNEWLIYEREVGDKESVVMLRKIEFAELNDEANDPFTRYVHSVRHNPLPWLISVSLDPNHDVAP